MFSKPGQNPPILHPAVCSLAPQRPHPRLRPGTCRAVSQNMQLFGVGAGLRVQSEGRRPAGILGCKRHGRWNSNVSDARRARPSVVGAPLGGPKNMTDHILVEYWGPGKRKRSRCNPAPRFMSVRGGGQCPHCTTQSSRIRPIP